MLARLPLALALVRVPHHPTMQLRDDSSYSKNVAMLKKIMYTPSKDAAQPEDSLEVKLGLHRDMPLTRWETVLLPHQQTVLNVFQPEYVHMFETLMSQPGPHFYFHVHLPGGTDNLANPEYALPGLGNDGNGGSAASVHGTIMQVVAARREKDARITMIVQGISRGIVLKGTRAMPYARADVFALPDAEALGDAARAARGWLRNSPAAPKRTDAQQRRWIAADSAAEDDAWRAYEYATRDIRGRLPPAFASFAPSAAHDCAKRFPTAVADAMVAATSSSSSAGSKDHAVVDECDTLLGAEGCDAVRDALSEAVEALEKGRRPARESLVEGFIANEAVEANDVIEAMECSQQLASLEIQVWLELDAILRAIAAKKKGALPVPSQLMSLMPEPPKAGWPDEFVLTKVVTEVRKSAAAKRSMDMFDPADDPEPFIPHAAELYPARRRAQRLSYSVWAMIRDRTDAARDLQAVLEVPSTSDRLRLALMRLRKLRELFGRGA